MFDMFSQFMATPAQPGGSSGGDVFAMFAQVNRPVDVPKSSTVSDEALLGQTLTATIRERASGDDVNQYIGVDEETGELPDRVVGTYTDDYDILHVHALIMARFRQRRDIMVDTIKRKLRELQGRLMYPLTLVERKSIQSEIDACTEDFNRITGDVDLHEYEEQSKQLLDLYRSIGTKIHTVSFAGAAADPAKDSEAAVDRGNVSTTDVDVDVEDPETQELRHLVISNYLEIARQYITVDVIREITSFSATKCGACQADLIDDDPSGGGGMKRCSECGVERNTLHRAPFYRDVERVNTSDRNGYDNSENFEKALMRYQGKQPNRLPAGLFADLDDYFRAYGLPVSDIIKQRPVNVDGEKEGTSRETMLKALSDTGYPTYYEDINLICHLYWGWLLPDVGHLEDQIMEDYRKTQQIYDQIPKDRKSCLNTQYRLFKHLEARGHRCKIDDFKVVKTRDILEYHDDTWRILCESAKLPFYETL